MLLLLYCLEGKALAEIRDPGRRYRGAGVLLSKAGGPALTSGPVKALLGLPFLGGILLGPSWSPARPPAGTIPGQSPHRVYRTSTPCDGILHILVLSRCTVID